MSLDDAALTYLRSGGREVGFEAGTPILLRGSPGAAFYVVLDGEVEIALTADDGARLRLSRLGAGASFGEMSVLTGEPVSADVYAATPTRLLEYPGERLRQGIAECASLRDHIISGLSETLRRRSTDTWTFARRLQALHSLMRLGDRSGGVVAESASMRRVRDQIAPLSKQRTPVLITGESGAGKFFVAKKIHESTANAETPLFVVDCSRYSDEEAAEMIFGTRGPVDFSKGSAGFGLLHMADQGTLVLRHVEALGPRCQAALAGYLAAGSSGTTPGIPRTRVFATTRTDLRARSVEGQFNAELASQLAAGVLPVPPMRERKKDILPMARLVLQEWCARTNAVERRLSAAAERALLAAPYRHGNAAELRESVELAAMFSDGGEIESESIFTGPKDAGAPAEYDLGRLSIVRRLWQGNSMTVLRSAILILFLAIISICLAGGNSSPARIANASVWGLWWPSVVLSAFLLGRVWCAVCPLSTAGRLSQRIRSHALAPPEWMKNYSHVATAALFIAIIWCEGAFGMETHPFATGILLAVLMVAAAASCLLLQREAWCRYLCPLGNLAASLAIPATLHVHSDSSVCSTQCTTHDCFKGSAQLPGCPVFHHPLYVRNAHQCKLCLTCLRSCRHGSARLFVRPPLQNIWRLGDQSELLEPFALTVATLALAMLASRKWAWAASAAGFTLCTIGSMVSAIALRRALKRVLRGGDGANAQIVFTILVLAWGALMAFHLPSIPGLADLRLQATAGSRLTAFLPATGVALSTLIRFGAVALAAVLAGIVVWGIRAQSLAQQTTTATGGAAALSRWRWRAAYLICAAYLLAVLTLILPSNR